MIGERAVTSIRERSTYSLILFRFGFVPSTRNFRKFVHPSVVILMECATLKIMRGLYTFISRYPPAPPKPTATSLAITWTAIMVTASAWVGFTLPGMIDEPGSFAGITNSAKPARGPQDISRMSLAIL